MDSTPFQYSPRPIHHSAAKGRFDFCHKGTTEKEMLNRRWKDNRARSLMVFPKVLPKSDFLPKTSSKFSIRLSSPRSVLPGNGRRFSAGEAKDVHLYGNAAAPTEHSAAGEISGHANNGVRNGLIWKK
ncbi:hypothetical protein CDAR_424261 [Caerostris darwini]|uniref:Uncharacterized protein n=1 Tax=Caerostris darwini TaxID=1538125 RepID=A0AAV4T5J6_9ARAC|nr:hypothetical protein CDAR_424261 [Caerostris darwini]